MNFRASPMLVSLRPYFTGIVFVAVYLVAYVMVSGSTAGLPLCHDLAVSPTVSHLQSMVRIDHYVFYVDSPWRVNLLGATMSSRYPEFINRAERLAGCRFILERTKVPPTLHDLLVSVKI